MKGVFAPTIEDFYKYVATKKENYVAIKIKNGFAIVSLKDYIDVYKSDKKQKKEKD